MKKYLLLIVPFVLCSCSKNTPTDKKIVVGASSTPHAKILEQIKDDVSDKGYKLIIKVFNDYVTPNLSLSSGDLDANYFQHTPYLEDFNVKNNTDLIGVAKVHFEPMGIYSVKHSNLSVAKPDIIIPNDVSNGDRARALLFANSINGSIREVEAQMIPALLPDCDYACINGNYALSSGIVDKCIVTEDSESDVAMTNANIIAVNKKYKDYEFVNVLLECLLTDKIRNYVSSTFGDAVKVVF